MAGKMSKNLKWLLVSAAVVFTAPLLGVATTVLFLGGAFRGTASVEPAGKARFLAEGISEAMNATACGIVVSLLALVPMVVFAVRLSREPRREPPKPE